MSKQFAEQVLDSMVDENGHCGERGLSVKQFNIFEPYLSAGEWIERGCWVGDYGRKYFNERYHEGFIGKYHVVLSEYWHFNLRCSVVSIDLRDADEYQAELDAEARLRELRDFSGSQWVSEPKKRIDMSLTLVNEYEYEGYSYSYYDSATSYIYTLRDADGNCIVWKTKTPLAMWVEDENGHEEWVEAEIGDTVQMKATIKEHGEYKGTKQTVISRPKLVSITK